MPKGRPVPFANTPHQMFAPGGSSDSGPSVILQVWSRSRLARGLLDDEASPRSCGRPTPRGVSTPQGKPKRAAKVAQGPTGTVSRRRVHVGGEALLFCRTQPEGTLRHNCHRVDGQVCTHRLAPLLKREDIAASFAVVPDSFAGHVCIMLSGGGAPVAPRPVEWSARGKALHRGAATGVSHLRYRSPAWHPSWGEENDVQC
jgi:hypothetical protein